AGFFVRLRGNDVPRYMIPLAGAPGQESRMHLRDLGVEPGGQIEVEVRAVDGAGNVGPSAKARGRVSDRLPAPLPAPLVIRRRNDTSQVRPRVGAVEVAIVDELDKVQPGTLKTLPHQPNGYLDHNHLWDAASKEIALHAARSELVGFQVVLKGNAR